MMRYLKLCLFTLLGVGQLTVASAHINPHAEGVVNPNPSTQQTSQNTSDRVHFRDFCDNAVAQIEQEINNVRARLTTGGDVWWDGTNARYVVPKPAPGETEVSSIFAGAVWLGGVDDANTLKVAAQQFGRSGGNFDFYPGPLIPDGPRQGLTDRDTCARWDRFFTVTGIAIDQHRANYQNALMNGETELDPRTISSEILGWPGRGNQFFIDIHNFELPDTRQGLAGFWDYNGNGDYEPNLGDYPIIEVRGCLDEEPPGSPDEMTFWVYNDAGNVHQQTDAVPINMEIQVQAFAYQTNDEINNMTFQRYKLINRALENINDTYFAMWVDPDLGCFSDDYVGCDVSRSLAYIYNVDALDGEEGGCSCGNGVDTYCDEIPILGIDYFRGPENEFGEELGMSSFIYYNNAGSDPTPLPGTTDPSTAQEYYNYLTGRWRDGQPLTTGDDGYNDGPETRYAFPGEPNDQNTWSMCSASLPVGDRRTIQASGPFRLEPGARNELIIGVVWVPDEIYPCPSLTRIQEADDKAQGLFDACFALPRGPDAPDVDWIELDQELIAVFTNSDPISNNQREEYTENGLGIPPGEDSLYRFEGYKLYQLDNPSVSLADAGDIDKVRLVYQVDVKNGVSKIFSWKGLRPEDGQTPTEDILYIPELRADGAEAGIRHTFRITEDQFAEGDRRLINHRKYYFVAIAYGYNNYQEFDPILATGQEAPYIESTRNIGDEDNSYYTIIPRPIVDRSLNSNYGDGPMVTRIDGSGTGGNFLDLADESRMEIATAVANGSAINGELTYQEGQGPLDVIVYNPLDVIDGEYELTFVDDNMGNRTLDEPINWVLRSLSDPSAPTIQSEQAVGSPYEQVIAEYGFSVNIENVIPPDVNPLNGSGIQGYEEEYAGENPVRWLGGYADDTDLIPGIAVDNGIFNYVLTGLTERDAPIDPNQAFSNIGPGTWIPYYMADWDTRTRETTTGFLTPAWTTGEGTNANYRGQTPLRELRNVDIVFTSDKSLWSRCVIVESANRYYTNNLGLAAVGNAKMFDPRAQASVTREDNDNNGQPDIDDSPQPGQATGMGYFPGYAVDVETGQRLNIFFGENSVYNGENLQFPDLPIPANQGADMMFNPSGVPLALLDGQPIQSLNVANMIAGGQHFVYVTKQPYDGCAQLRQFLTPSPNPLIKIAAISEIIWAGFLDARPGTQMRSYSDGLIPNDVRVKLRVDQPYKVKDGTGEFDGYPTYRFTLEGKQADPLDMVGVENALDLINTVPNPYYGFSQYEDSQFETVIKITNLPPKCVVTIYSLEGKFIRQYNRNEVGALPRGDALSRQQVNPDLEWDLKNFKSIPIASGVYLIHVSAEGLGERTLKWFGVNRQFDPSGL